MPRVNETKKSRKAWICGRCGKEIAIGGSFWWWQPMGQEIKRRCKACGYPKPSDLTSSDKKQRVLKAQEDVEEAANNVANTTVEELSENVSQLISALQEAAEEIRSVGEEYGEAADNMESSFPSGSSVIDELHEKAETCETWASNLEEAVSTIEGLDVEDIDCDECSGNGTVDCETCDGTGEVTEEHDMGASETLMCPDCGGEGTQECDKCSGDGKYIQEILDSISDAVENAMSETLE